MARTKGSHVLQLVKFLRKNRERCLAELPPHLHKYLEDRILPATWYPAEDHLVLLRMAVSLMPAGMDPWFFFGRNNARQDLTEIYRHHLRAGEPGRTLKVLEAIWTTVHDNGKMIVTLDGERAAEIRMTGNVPKEFCGMVPGYVVEAATLSGALKARCTHTSCRYERGTECVWRAEWVGVKAA